MTVPIGGQVARIDGEALVDMLGRWSTPDGPLYRLLSARIARLADTGELPAGLRLPPERELAAALNVSRNTVALAYQLLRDDGMAESRQGSGTRIGPHRTTPAAVHRANGLFSGLLAGSAVAADLTMAAVACAPQVAAALEAPASVLAESGRSRVFTDAPGYFPAGVPELRAAIAAMLTSRHGIPTTAEQVIVTTGAQQALDLLIRCEVLPGQAAVTEDPTFPGALDALHRAGARLVGVPPGDVERLADAVRAHAPGLVYLIPTHQNPVGTVLPTAARHKLAELAARHPDVTFVDDMAMAEVPLTDAPPPPPLAALSPHQPNIATVGSLSKTYWGGLRTGWVRAPEGIIARLAAAKAAADLGATAYQQAIVAALISQQHDEILKWRAEWTHQRYTALASALRSRLPGWIWTPPAGGLTVWAQLPGVRDTSAFAQTALRHGVAVIPGRLASVAGNANCCVRLAFTASPEVLTAAVEALAEAAAGTASR
ncbi:MAG TPA: PLP-dependent aminotransferase family protein [Trebonia sp.]